MAGSGRKRRKHRRMPPSPPSPASRPFSWAAIAARLCDALPAMTAGDAGCLMPDDLDPDALAFLSLIDGAEGPWSWRRDTADPALLVLDRVVLGLEVAAPDPCLLATALEHLADAADRRLAAAQALSERLEVPLRPALAAVLRREVAVLAVEVPGARFRPQALPAEAAAPAAHPEAEAFHAPVVEDHRLLRQR